jgi:hypothetical protein
VLKHGIPLFLDQLIKTLSAEQTSDSIRSRRVSGSSGGGTPVLSEIGATAARHGRELLEYEFTVDQVVHGYGDLCQAITESALEHDVAIDVDEFRTLNRCLDNAIAEAVTEFTYQRDLLFADGRIQTFNERLGCLGHELRNLIDTATLVFTAIKAGNVGVAGATGAVLDRSLVAIVGSLEAHERGCHQLAVSLVEPDLAVDADRDLLLSAIANLLQNAFKFTAKGTGLSLTAYAAADRVRIDVEDNCGGLRSGGAERMFLPFTQCGPDRSATCRGAPSHNLGRDTAEGTRKKAPTIACQNPSTGRTWGQLPSAWRIPLRQIVSEPHRSRVISFSA